MATVAALPVRTSDFFSTINFCLSLRLALAIHPEKRKTVQYQSRRPESDRWTISLEGKLGGHVLHPCAKTRSSPAQ